MLDLPQELGRDLSQPKPLGVHHLLPPPSQRAQTMLEDSQLELGPTQKHLSLLNPRGL